MMAAMPMLVPDKHLLRINTLDQLLASVASIGAPAFGIFLYTTLGFSSVMFLDFAGACVAVLGLALAKIPTVVDATAKEQHVLANLRDGWRAIAKTRGLVLLIGGVTIGMMIFGPLSAVFPLMTYQHFGGRWLWRRLWPRRPSASACSWARASLSFGAAASASQGSRPWQPWSWRGHRGLRASATRRLPGLYRAGGCDGRGLCLVQRPHHDAHPTQRARRQDGRAMGLLTAAMGLATQ